MDADGWDDRVHDGHEDGPLGVGEEVGRVGEAHRGGQRGCRWGGCCRHVWGLGVVWTVCVLVVRHVVEGGVVLTLGASTEHA